MGERDRKSKANRISRMNTKLDLHGFSARTPGIFAAKIINKRNYHILPKICNCCICHSEIKTFYQSGKQVGGEVLRLIPTLWQPEGRPFCPTCYQTFLEHNDDEED